MKVGREIVLIKKRIENLNKSVCKINSIFSHSNVRKKKVKFYLVVLTFMIRKSRVKINCQNNQN